MQIVRRALLFGKIFDIDAPRNAAIADAISYDQVSVKDIEFQLLGRVKAVLKKMPLFSTMLANLAKCPNEAPLFWGPE